MFGLFNRKQREAERKAREITQWQQYVQEVVFTSSVPDTVEREDDVVRVER